MSLWPEMANGSFAIKFIDAGGIRTRYLEAGNLDAPALIFIHGTGGHLETFNRNVFEHAKHFRVLALDMVGHGYSSRPDHPYEIKHYVKHLVDFMAALGISKSHMHGESMGGWIAAQFAIDHPAAVDRLALNTAGGLNTDEKVMDRVYSVTMNAVKEGTFEAVRKRLEWLVHEPTQIPNDLVELRQNIYRQPGFVKSMENILCLQFMETRMRNVLTDESLARIKAKTLVIWTDHDPTAPVATGERFARCIPDARLVVMSDCAHWPQWEKTGEFNALHTGFLLGN
ncbi:MAG: alpha/beta fold hydrolase [Pseudomonadota bacterium]